MLRFYGISIAALLGFGAVALSPMPSFAQRPTDPDARDLVHLVVNWSEGLESFSGSYRLLQEGKGFTEDVVIEYRFQGQDRWFYQYTPAKNEVWNRAIYKGVFDERTDKADPETHDVQQMVVINSDGGWGLDPFNCMFPDRLIKTPYVADETLGELLSRGHNFAFIRDGEPVLSHWVNDDIGSNVDIYFSPQGHVIKMEWCFRFGIPTPEKMQEMLPELAAEIGAFNIRTVDIVFNYMDYVDFGGYFFPAFVEKLAYDQGEAGEEIQAAYAAGLPFKEYARRVYEATPVLQCRSTFTVEPSEIEINTALRENDFAIEYDKEAIVLDAGKNKKASVFSLALLHTKAKALFALLITLVQDYRFWLCLVALLGGLVGVRRMLRRKASQ